MLKKVILFGIIIGLLGTLAAVGGIFYMHGNLPKLMTAEDYAPLLVTEVFDRNGNKVGEFSREKRILVAYEEIPKTVINAFLAAEDSTFFDHGGINYFAIARAALANLRAGEKVQGALTITQQVARSLLLTREKTYTRKIKEVLLSYQMEKNLTKENILYLYLNQIFLGHNSYGIVVATKTYFNKDLKDITLAEAAILAGLPKAPSTLNPITSPVRAKERQGYVLHRMLAENMISEEDAKKAIAEPVQIFMRKSLSENAPAFMDTIKQILSEKVGEDTLSDKGIRIYSSLDLPKQLAAQKSLQEGLRELDKRQGYRGPLENIDASNAEEYATKVADILVTTRNELLDDLSPYKVLQSDGTFPSWGPLNLTGFQTPKEGDTMPPVPLPVLPEYVKPGSIVKAVVLSVDDEWGLTQVRFAESKGLIDVENMKWARVPDLNVDSRWAQEVKKPSAVLKKGDVILVRVIDEKFTSQRIDDKLKELKKKEGKNYKEPTTLPLLKDFAEVTLEQEPQAEAALISIDQKNDDVIAMVGGYKQVPGQLNRAIQTARQSGSSFKSFVYTAALDKDFTPSTAILDAPIVYEEEQEVVSSDQSESITKKWKPTNYSNRFVGDILFRNALIQSLNVPTVKIIEKVGVHRAMDYARRLGIFSPLNPDFTLALGSSSVTLYEMTKAFAEIGRLGRRARPVLIHKIEDKDGKPVLDITTNEPVVKVYLDERFQKELSPLEEEYEKRRVAYLDWKKAHPSDGNPQTDESTSVEEAPKIPEPNPAQAETLGDGTAFKLPNPAKEPPLFFKDPDQLIKPETAYVMTSLLQAVVEDEDGTAGRARALGRPAAGKTGTTSKYYDAWFIGFTANISTGVWVGYDKEQSLGNGEAGGRAALPIWVEYMKAAEGDAPPANFAVPDGIVFASIDNETGKLASANSKHVVRQAFLAGTEPTDVQDESSSNPEDTSDFYKEDLSQ